MKYIFYIGILVFVYCCTREDNQIPDLGRKIVINGLLSTDSLINIHISRSSYINGEDAPDLTLIHDLDSADVKIYNNDYLIDSLSHVSFFYLFDFQRLFNPGNYLSSRILPSAGSKYKIVVKSRNLPEANVTLTIPDSVHLIKVDTTGVILPSGSFYEYNTGFKCSIEFNDPPETTNYYLFDIREKYSELSDKNLDFICQDPIIEENLISGLKVQAVIFSDKLINGKTNILTVVFRKEQIGHNFSNNTSRVCFRLYSINEEYFNYIRTLYQYNKNFGNPLAEPVMVYSNIENGYGMVAGAAVSSYSVDFPL